MRVALTGATGLVGELLVPALLRRGHEVRALARPRPGRSLPRLPGLEWVAGRMDELEPLARLVEGADAIVHAAFMHPEPAPLPGRSEAEHYVRANYLGTLRLLERAPATRAGQFVYVSSLAVYGRDPNRDPRGLACALDEDYPVRAPEFYGAMRSGVEAMCYAASQAYGLNVSVFRLGLVIGRRAGFEETPFSSSVLEALEHGELCTTHAAFALSAEDAAEILAAAVGDASLRGQVYNTFDRWLDYAELAPILSEILGREVRVACARIPEPPARILCERIHRLYPGFRTDAAIRALLERLVREARALRQGPA